MTWSQFINSEYNTDNFRLEDDHVWWNGYVSLIDESKHEMNGVFANDIILDDDTIPAYMYYYTD
jgi:hypothetical protein